MSARPFAVEGGMTIYRAAELKAALLTALEAPGPLALDLSGVTEVDTAGVQLLWLARDAARASGRELRFLEPSEAVREVASLLRLRWLLGTEERA